MEGRWQRIAKRWFSLEEDETAAEGNDISVIGKNSHLEGKHHFKGHLIVQGSIEGTLEAERMTTEKGSQVSAKVKAEYLTVGGSFVGDMEVTGLLRITPTADVKGQILYRRLVVDEGGVINGQVALLQKTEREDLDL